MENEILEEEAPMYLWAGRALCEAQNLETHLKNLIVVQQVIRGDAANVPSLEEIYAKHDRKTLGKLLGTVREIVPFGVALETRLQGALEARNVLVHRYFADVISRHGFKKGLQAAPAELRSTAEELSIVASELCELSVRYASALGLKPEMINKHLRKTGADFELEWPSS